MSSLPHFSPPRVAWLNLLPSIAHTFGIAAVILTAGALGLGPASSCHCHLAPKFAARAAVPPAASPSVTEATPVPAPPPVPERTPRPVDADKELLIRDLRVVESLRATQPGGPWHIGTLFSNLSPARVSPSTLMLGWLRSWESNQVSAAPPGARPTTLPSLTDSIINPWIGSQSSRADQDVQLDWSRAPFRLLAIVSRTDLARPNPGAAMNAGEGRFVFGMLDPAGQALPVTLVLQYSLPATNLPQILAWNRAWHSLGDLPDYDETYLAALQRLTDGFTRMSPALADPAASAPPKLLVLDASSTSPPVGRSFVASPPLEALAPTAARSSCLVCHDPANSPPGPFFILPRSSGRVAALASPLAPSRLTGSTADIFSSPSNATNDLVIRKAILLRLSQSDDRSPRLPDDLAQLLEARRSQDH